MITRLELEDFGKFKKGSVEFGPFTVIIGANEAGKTTVFDALFEALCADTRKENLVPWKRLADRYGALRKAQLSWKGEPFAFGYEEFLEIFAIRAGDSDINAANGRSWEATAEARLLNAGLNPTGLALSLTKKAETTGKGSVQARIKELNKLIKARELELDGLKGRRDAIFAGEVDTVRLEAELKIKNAEIEARRAELAALCETEFALADACKLAAALDGIKALRELKETEDAMAGLAGFESSEMPVYRALLSEQRERERAVAAAEAAIAERRAAAATARTAAEQLAAREPVLKRQVETAETLSAKLAAFAATPPKTVITINKAMRYGIWAGAVALAAFVAYSGHKVPAYIAAAAIAGAGAWVGLKLSVKESQVGLTPDEIKTFMNGLGVEWAMVSEEPLPEDMQAAPALFARPAADHAALVEAYNAKAAEVGDLETGLGVMESDLAESKKVAQAAADTAAGWLKEHGCATEDEYQARLTEREKLAARSADLHARVIVFLQRNSCDTIDELKDKLFNAKEALDRKGVDPAKADEPELERMKKRTDAMGGELRALEGVAGGIKSALERAQAVAGAKLESLPEQINRIENELASAREEIAGLELQVEAYLLAAKVFNKLAEKSTVAFHTLSKEVVDMLEKALPGQEAHFGSFDAGEATMKDAGGHLRHIKNLSSGTRDLFMLGARLVMARKARTGDDGIVSPGLLVLDDPFYTLDYERERAALRLLADFQRETGWQIIILTKDVGLAQASLAVALDVKIVELK